MQENPRFSSSFQDTFFSSIDLIRAFSIKEQLSRYFRLLKDKTFIKKVILFGDLKELFLRQMFKEKAGEHF